MPIILNGTTGITTPGITNTGPFTFQGVVELPAGAVGAPSLTTTGDTNTGIYFPAADTIGFVEGGVESMRLTSAGNVGIGTNNPVAFSNQTSVTVNGTNNGRFDIRVGGTHTAAFVGGGSAVELSAITSVPMTFATNSVERMRLDTSGNLGIGTSSPEAYSGYKTLEVQGSTGGVFQSSNTAGTQKALFTTNSVGATLGTITNSPLLFQTNNSEKARIDAAGNMGLGVTPSAWNSAYTAFQSRNASFFGTTNATEAAIGANALIAAGGGRYISNGQASIYQQVNGTHIWYNAPSGTAGAVATFTQAMTLDASGNLGVGTTSPTSIANYKTVTVNGTTGSLVDLASNGTVGARIQCDTSYPGMALFGLTNNPMVFGTNAVERARITSGGNLLVGTTANYSRLTVSNGGFTRSGITISDTTTASLMLFAGASADAVIAIDSNNLVFKTGANVGQDNGTERARIASNGEYFYNCTGRTGDAPNVAGGRINEVNGNEKVRVLFDGIPAFQFYSPTGGTGGPVGTINVNAGGVSYNTTSDVRLKKNIENALDAGHKFDALRVCQFDWKTNGDHVDYGFIAQELNEVVPDAVSKPMNPDEMWGVDYSKLVPMLVKEIQSLRARLAAAGI